MRAAAAANSGHPTSSMSAADLMAVLLARHFRYDWQRPDDPANDHLIFSKGHASPLLYSMFKAAGVVSDDELATRRAALNGVYAPRARDRKVSQALRAYAAMATSADKGAVRDVSKLG